MPVSMASEYSRIAGAAAAILMSMFGMLSVTTSRPRVLTSPAQVGKAVGRRSRRPQMSRMHHQLKLAEPEIGEAGNAAMRRL